ncbi:hypothetical protein HaLaN_30987, partial [Haematococcus lacustris]
MLWWLTATLAAVQA